MIKKEEKQIISKWLYKNISYFEFNIEYIIF